MIGIFPPDCPNCDNSCGKTAQVSKTEKRENPRNLNDFKGFRNIGVTGFEPAASWSRTKHSTGLSHTPIAPIVYHKGPGLSSPLPKFFLVRRQAEIPAYHCSALRLCPLFPPGSCERRCPQILLCTAFLFSPTGKAVYRRIGDAAGNSGRKFRRFVRLTDTPGRDIIESADETHKSANPSFYHYEKKEETSWMLEVVTAQFRAEVRRCLYGR